MFVVGLPRRRKQDMLDTVNSAGTIKSAFRIPCQASLSSMLRGLLTGLRCDYCRAFSAAVFGAATRSISSFAFNQ